MFDKFRFPRTHKGWHGISFFITVHCFEQKEWKTCNFLVVVCYFTTYTDLYTWIRGMHLQRLVEVVLPGKKDSDQRDLLYWPIICADL